MQHEMSRRSFLAGLAGTAAVGGTMAMGLAGCGGQPSARGGSENGSAAAAASQGSYAWEQVPEPIDEHLVSEELECEICVVGAGNAGVVAALTAVEEGADVVVMQKHDHVQTQGTGHACVYSKLQESLGIDCDEFIPRAVRQWQKDSACQGKWELLNVWIDHSGEMDDWINAHLEGTGIFEDMTYDKEWRTAEDYISWMPFSCGYGNEDPTGEVGCIAAMTELGKQAEQLGARFVWSVTGERLEQDDSGRVVAILGKKADDTYVRVKASKGVILCTGGYDSNMEMRAKYLPHSRDFPECSDNFGEGLLMSLWAGARIEDGPHCTNLHFDIFPVSPTTAWGSSMPWLRVNTEGRRVGNEAVAYHWIALQCGEQPDGNTYQIFDSDFDKYYPAICEGKTGLFKTVPDMAMCRAAYEPAVQESGLDTSTMTDLEVVYEGCVVGGSAYRADTLEELASLAGIDADKLKATVDHYNEMYDAGMDEDCFKEYQCMSAVRTPPFYCIPRRPYVLGTLGGVDINEKMQVLDTEGNVIPGLYAAGNTSGNLFGGLVQSMAIPALTIGRAHTFGRLAAKYCASEA